MSFPVSPLDGQSAIVNNILYIYNQADNTWTRVPGTTILGGVSNTDGVLIWNTANGAFGVANTANSLARGAFTLGNTTSSTVATHTGYINSIYPKTNAAFDKANTSYDLATSAYAAANAAGSSSTITSAFDTANGAFALANTNTTSISLVGDYANGAFALANSGTAAAGAASFANGAFVRANSASITANSAAVFSNAAFATANSKTFIFYQNTAPTTANTRDAWVDSDTGIKYQNLNGTTPLWVELGPTTAVSESPIAQAAYDTSNTALTYGLSGFDKANSSYVLASSGYDKANTAFANANGPAFRAYVSTPQAIPGTGVQTKTTFGSETFDTNSNFDSSRFTPTVAGYYQLNCTVRIQGGSGSGECMITIWKNGSEYARGTNESGSEQGASFYSMQVSDLAYANGTGDYFEVYVQQATGSNKDTTAGANISYFSGAMVRGA